MLRGQSILSNQTIREEADPGMRENETLIRELGTAVAKGRIQKSGHDGFQGFGIGEVSPNEE